MAFGKRRSQSLAGKLHQTEPADAADLHAGTVRTDRVTQALLDFALVLGVFHVDEVDHDKAA